MNTLLAVPSLVLLLLLLSASPANSNNLDDACKVTGYRQLCEKTLAPYAHDAGKSPTKWAQAGVKVTILDMKGLMSFLKNTLSSGKARGSVRGAVSECVSAVDGALGDLRDALRILKSLNKRRFREHMDDVTTRIGYSDAETGSCAEEFGNGGIEGTVKKRLTYALHLMSNANALALKLADSGSPS